MAENDRFFFDRYGLTPANLERYLAEALSDGGDYSDLYFEHTTSSSLLVDESLVKTALEGISMGCGVRVLAGVLAAVAGIVVDPAGVLLALGAAACQTVFVLVSRHGYAGVGSDVATLVILVGTLIGAVAIAVLGGVGSQLEAPVRSLDPWPIILVAGVLGAGLPSMLFLSAIRRIGGIRTGILMLFEPVVGVTLAALLLRESIDAPQLLGGALVLGAAVLLQVSAEPSEEAATVSEAAPAI